MTTRTRTFIKFLIYWLTEVNILKYKIKKKKREKIQWVQNAKETTIKWHFYLELNFKFKHLDLGNVRKNLIDFTLTFFTPRYEYTYNSFPKLKHILSLKFCWSCCCCCCDTDTESEMPFDKDVPATFDDDVVDDWCGMYFVLFDVTFVCMSNW